VQVTQQGRRPLLTHTVVISVHTLGGSNEDVNVDTVRFMGIHVPEVHQRSVISPYESRVEGARRLK
jgi:hypothetical protein